MAVSQTESTNHFDLSDGQLLRRFAQRREQAAFELLVRRHGPLVMQVCQRVVGDRHLAEDVDGGSKRWRGAAEYGGAGLVTVSKG